MTDFGWRLVEGAAQLLDLREREAVLGDLAEADANAWSGFLDVLGLALRRQVLLWKSWRPWMAALGVALPGSFSLMGFSLLVSGMFREILGWNVTNDRLEGTALVLSLLLICRVLLLIICAWSGGLVVGVVSGRTLWVSIAACFAPCLFCFSRFRVSSQSPWELLVFVLPAIWGVWQGVRGRPVTRRLALALAMTATVLAVPAWTGPRIFVLVLIWPGWYLAATSHRRPLRA